MTKTNIIDNQPLVSIIINCYNGEKYLREAIDSVYKQSYENWEIIFWDNASKDKSAKIAKSYSSKMRYFRGGKTIPLGAARNKVLKQCEGEYIAFLDVDDIWLPEKLELQVKKMQENPESIVCYSDGYYMYENKKSKKKLSSYPNMKFYGGDIFNKLILSNFINWQTVLINKDLASNNLYFNSNLTYAEDHEILLRLSLCGKIIFSKIPLVYYRKHKSNMSRNYQLILKETEEIFEIFNNEIIKRKININKAKSLIYGSIIIKLIIENGDYKKYTKYLLKYLNIQNIIIFILLKLRLFKLLALINKH